MIICHYKFGTKLYICLWEVVAFRLRKMLYLGSYIFGKLFLGKFHFWEVFFGKIAYLGSCFLANYIFGKFSFGKLHILEVSCALILLLNGSAGAESADQLRGVKGRIFSWKITYLGSFLLENCIFGSCFLENYIFGKFSFGKLHICEAVSWYNDVDADPHWKKMVSILSSLLLFFF